MVHMHDDGNRYPVGSPQVDLARTSRAEYGPPAPRYPLASHFSSSLMRVAIAGMFLSTDLFHEDS